MKRVFLIFSILFIVNSCDKLQREKKVDKNKLLSSDYRLFQDTPAWELAKAVWDGDRKKIRHEIAKNPIILDYQEPLYGKTLLHLSVYNGDYTGFKELLSLGSNPNIADYSYCSSPLIVAVNIFTEDRLEYVKQLLKHGANVNYVECSNGKQEQKTNRTALMVACLTGHFEQVKILVENGANINYENNNQENALDIAVLSNNTNIVLYLLQKGADCNRILYQEGSSDNLKNIYLKDWLEKNKQILEYYDINKIIKERKCG